MHEYHIAKDIINEAKKKGNPVSITLEIGSLSPLTPHEIKETLSHFVKWNVIVKTKKGTVKCKCGFKGEPIVKERMHDFVYMECPKCRNSSLKVIEGGNIKLASVQVR